jgi:hypothetical protein
MAMKNQNSGGREKMISRKLYAVAIVTLMAGSALAQQAAPELTESDVTGQVGQKEVVAQVPQAGNPVASANQDKAPLFPMIAERITPLETKPTYQPTQEECEKKTDDGLTMGCPIPLTDTGETTPDGIEMMALPIKAPIPHYGDDGDARLTFVTDKNNVVAKYEVCHEIPTHDAGTRCTDMVFAFPKLSYDESSRTILLGNNVVATYHSVSGWGKVLVACAFTKDHCATTGREGFVLSNGLKLTSAWLNQAEGEPSLQVALENSSSK